MADHEVGALRQELEAERAARLGSEAEAARFRSLFQNMGQGFCELELVRDAVGAVVDQHYIAFNPAFERLFGIPIAEAEGRNASEVFPGLETWWHEAFDRVARSGKPERLEHRVAALDRWFEVFAYPHDRNRLTVLYEDVTERRRAEDALAQSEERQAFLLAFSDALRDAREADAVAERAIRMLSERMRLDRCYLATYRLEDDRADITHQVGSDRLPPMPATIRLSDFPEALRVVHDRTLVIDDVLGEPSLSDADKQNISSLGFGALMAPTLRKGAHRPLWVVVAVSIHPRRWTPGEILLIEEVAERTWAAVERAKAEALQRETEERFREFAASSSGVLWIRNAASLDMEYVSPAVEAIYGLVPEAILGEVKHWASHIVPEDRDAALKHLEQACRGEAVTHEFRILRASDGAFRWIRDTLFSLRDAEGLVQRVGGIAEEVTEARQAAEHQKVLLLELQHRVRNILAMIRSMANRTGDTAADVDNYRDRLEGRLRALAHVQVLLTRSANAGVDLATLIRNEVEAQAELGSQLTLAGPELLLSPKAAEVVTLAIHELTTNAVKYGALRDAGGLVGVVWHVAYEAEEPWLRLDWNEAGASALPEQGPARRGFGTTLIEQRIPYELRGRGSLSFEPKGLRCHLTFPLKRGDSILETDVVTLSTTIEGGSLDMAGEADLSGCRILVVEDDFYLAADTERALRMAKAEVLGPVGQEDLALALIAGEMLTCALVDINLGDGAQFKVADTLREKGVPFVFMTGYDDVVIPERFSNVQRMRKPADFRHVVRAAATMCRSGA